MKLARSIAIAGLALVAACNRRQAATPPRVPVSVARAEQRAVPYQITGTGIVEPIRTVDVTSQVNGLLLRVRFNEGDDVQQGQVLFEIDPRPYQAALQQAEANLSRDVVQFQNAALEAERAQQLETGGLGTAEDRQQKQATRDALAATLRADSAGLATARLNLDYATIRAPIAGRTGGLQQREGNLIRANATLPLVTINQIHPIYVRFGVPAARLPDLLRHAGAALPVFARPGRDSAAAIEGVLSFLDNHVDTATGTVMLKARYPNASGALWPGEFVDVTLVLEVQQGATVVPAQAVMTGQQGPYIYTVERDSTAKQHPVVVSRTQDSVAIVTSGVSPGDVVVTDGQLRLTPGAKVDVKEGNDRTTASMGGRGPQDSTPRSATRARPGS